MSENIAEEPEIIPEKPKVKVTKKRKFPTRAIVLITLGIAVGVLTTNPINELSFDRVSTSVSYNYDVFSKVSGETWDKVIKIYDENFGEPLKQG
jgi:hypothetical protein